MGPAQPDARRATCPRVPGAAMNRSLVLVAAAVVAYVGFGAQQQPYPSFRSSVNGMTVDVGEQERGIDSLENRYLALVQRYRQGDVHAIAEIQTWKDAEIRKAIDRLSRLTVRGRAMSAGEVAAGVKAAAVMMHTDAGIADIVKQGKPESLHLEVAHGLMLESAASPFGGSDNTLSGFSLRNWVLAVVQLLVHQMAYEPARSLLGAKGSGGAYRALLDGTDRDLVLAAGWLEESAAFYGERVLASDATTASVSTELGRTAFMTRSQQAGREKLRVREARQRAERLYRRVLQLAATCDEARLRLGRVLFDEGQSAEAARHLERVLAQSGEPRQRCLAALFLGALHEKAGKTDAAIGLYSEAVAADRRSQAARVALSAALDAEGQSTPARDAIGPLAARRSPDRSYTDPWSAYVLGQADSDRLSELRSLVVER